MSENRSIVGSAGREKVRSSKQKRLHSAMCRPCPPMFVIFKKGGKKEVLQLLFKKELFATIKTFRDSLVSPSASQPSTFESSQVPSLVPENLSEDPSARQSPAPPGEGSEEEKGNRAEVAPSKFKLSLEEVDGLLGAIRVTLGLSEEKELTLHNCMYAGLGEPRVQTFLVNSVISDSIRKEWQELEKRRFPFEEDPSAVWNKVPRWMLPSSRSIYPLT